MHIEVKFHYKYVHTGTCNEFIITYLQKTHCNTEMHFVRHCVYKLNQSQQSRADKIRKHITIIGINGVSGNTTIMSSTMTIIHNRIMKNARRGPFSHGA